MPRLTAPELIIVDPIPSSFPRKGPADTELEFFFSMADSAMGVRSNFAAMIRKEKDTMDTFAEAARALRLIRGLLRRLGSFDAGVLSAAYLARRWPLALREELGRVTGVVVRLACVDVGLPDDDDALADLELRTAARLGEALDRRGKPALARYREQGLTLLRRAFESYERARGGPDRRSPAGVS
jgi:hypothetical protein